jgi:hypothetical protein
VPRNRLDFVRPGTVAGQVAEVSGLAGNAHKHYRDGPHGEPIEYTVPGVDTNVRLSGHPFDYRVRAIPTDDGPKVVELHIDSPEHDVPLTPDDLRKLAKYLDRLAYAANTPLNPDTDAFHKPEKAPPKRPGARGHGQAFYAEVALFAKEAHQRRMSGSSSSVRDAIAKHWQVTNHTADKWLARARERDLLKAGELGGKPKPRKGTAK